MSSEPVVDDFLLLILSSPSGAGKTTLCTRLRGECPELRFSVSHTTRKPRGQERQGREYHFIDEKTFRAKIRLATRSRRRVAACGNALLEMVRANDRKMKAKEVPTVKAKGNWRPLRNRSSERMPAVPAKTRTAAR